MFHGTVNPFLLIQENLGKRSLRCVQGRPEQLMLCAPVVTVVEAKNENIIGGMGQCIAEMAAAQLFNQQEKNVLQRIYGVVTSGNIWRFLRMERQKVSVDLQDYYIEHTGKILGIFSAMIKQTA